ncbi:hypothetical protein CK203_032483 [Vitis vinifera]|uniref:Endonuclease/exonuclease/phosphatase domain-containing protein n=1 Tax=Vitis vinifera TaxID=29760 RepID=A0A438I6L5_VITVI|nr:hypothetical protein CK203_032483 [Vitis vinifera]
MELLAIEDVVAEESLPGRLKFTDKALLEEASRGADEGWSSSCLAKFSRCLGMPTEGFKEEILYLLRRMKGELIKRGANDRDKRKIIKSVIKSQRVDVVCLQETKIKEMTTGLVRSLGVGRHLDWRAVNSKGATGGIVVFWDNRMVELVDLEEGVFSISHQLKNCVDGLVWVFTGVYGPFAVEIERIFRGAWVNKRFME